MTMLPEPWRSVHKERSEAIDRRLNDFAAITSDNYFYELAYCILTPQSSARNAEATIAELQRDQFVELGFDPTLYLRNPAHYIRFHNVKSKRLLATRDTLHTLLPIVGEYKRSAISATALREAAIQSIGGLGMKEASHFLRNIGVRGLAILDRHIFKHLARLGVIEEIPKNAPTKKRYLEIEQAWHAYANQVGISLDQLDLLFWSMETGEILK